MENNCLYHYCSVETFQSIITNKTIRLSEITKSNDKGEIRYLWKEYISHLESNYKNEWAPHTMKYFFKEQLDNTYFLAICFSEEYDSLHMWDYYGSGGVCIGFNKEKLSAWSGHIDILNNKIICKENKNCGIAMFNKVEYCEKQDIKEKIKKLCDGAEYVTDPFEDLLKKTAFIKSKLWEEEAEWRVALIATHSEQRVSNDQNYIKAELHADKNSKASCDIPFDLNMIENITLASNFEADVSEFKNTLRYYNLDFLADRVRQSKVSII